MLAGKRCSPVVIYVALAFIVISLTFLLVKRGPDRRPNAAPLHQPQ
ncbi:MAG TPA: hypothetical protein VMB18_18395 [Terriglobales bacterium]|nr:hypothetical protein [Terriglobales bacterium]